MRKNELNLWQPTNGCPSKMFFEGLHDNYEGFRILLKGEDSTSSMLKIHFEDALTYKNTDESYLLKIWHNSSKDILGKTFYTCLLYTSPSPRDKRQSRMPSSA